ncbi:unnamed protein product [Symbiodinium sp. KB8]|nr:unnamed protein product [Symbiodinium sp. KB8]
MDSFAVSVLSWLNEGQGLWNSVTMREWLLPLLFLGTCWTFMFSQVYRMRGMLVRTLQVVGRVDARLQQLEAELLQVRTVPRGASPREAPGSDAAVDMLGQVLLACEDVRGVTMTTQHACDMLGHLDKQLHNSNQEMMDLVRSHVELSKVVNQMVDNLSTHLRDSPNTIPAAWVDELKAALTPSVQLLKTVRDAVESGLDGLNKQMADQDLSTLTTTFKEVLDCLGQIKAATDAIKTQTATDVSRDKLDKLEQLTRSKTTSIYEEIGLVKGQASQLHKDTQALLSKMTKTVEHLSAVQDGLAGSMAQIVATFSRPQPDPPGLARLVDTTLQQAEMLKELESHVATLREGQEELNETTKEIRERTPERPPYRAPPPAEAAHTQPRPAPQVIDLQSRVPTPMVRPLYQMTPGGDDDGLRQRSIVSLRLALPDMHRVTLVSAYWEHLDRLPSGPCASPAAYWAGLGALPVIQASDALAEAGFAVPRWVDLLLTSPGIAPHPRRTMPTLMIRMSRIGVGNALRLASAMIVPRPSTAVLSGLRSSPSSTHSPALSPPGCSPFVLSPQSSPSTLRSSGSRFSVACGSLCHLFLHDAVVGVRLMLWVTMSLPALGLVFSGHGVGRLNVPLPGSAGRLVPLSPQGDRQRLAVVGRLAACG